MIEQRDRDFVPYVSVVVQKGTAVDFPNRDKIKHHVYSFSPANQRPDATEFDFDTTRTSLTGYAAGLNASKNSGKHWLGSVGVSTESPYWELNDAGRLQSANDADAFLQVRYRENTRGRLFHRWSSNAFLGRGWNYGGVVTYTEASLGNSFTFHNFMRLFLGVYGNHRSQSDDLTRGGPLMGDHGGIGGDVELSGNEGKPVTWNAGLSWVDDEAGGHRGAGAP